jgi:hypothetical protein
MTHYNGQLETTLAEISGLLRLTIVRFLSTEKIVGATLHIDSEG